MVWLEKLMSKYMNREIKFRAWDKQLKEMFDVESINFNEDIVYVNSRSRNHIETQRRVSDDICTLMQYTGLKDKNGKEIYEGDIVEVEAVRMIVEFGTARFIGRYGNGLDYHALHTLIDLKIIGNIYENKEQIMIFQ